MAHSNVGAIQKHADHVESVGLRLPSVAVDPDHRRALQFFAFAIVDCLDRTTELRAPASLYLDKGDCPIPLDDQIDVAVTAAEPALNHAPAPPPKPSLSDSFSEGPKGLPGR